MPYRIQELLADRGWGQYPRSRYFSPQETPARPLAALPRWLAVTDAGLLMVLCAMAIIALAILVGGCAFVLYQLIVS